MNYNSKVVFLPLLSLILLLSLYASTAARLGGWNPIRIIDGTSITVTDGKPIDVNDPLIAEIGEFAVSEYNKESKSKLKFEKVVRGEYWTPQNTYYRLIIVASEGGVSKNYEANVWEDQKKGDMILLSFEPVANNARFL